MTGRKKYDAIFVGSSLTSLAAAAMLSKKGKSVLCLIGADPDPPTPLFRFAQGPLLYLGFEEGGAMEGFFSELRFPLPNLRKEGLSFKRLVPFLQTVQDNHRIDLYPQRGEFLDELKREFGGQIHKIKLFIEEIEKEALELYPYLGRFSQLEMQGLGDRFHAWRQRLQFQMTVRNHKNKTAAEFLAPFSFDEEFSEFLSLQSLFAFRKPVAEISSYELILLISGLSKGGVRMIGGGTTLISFFLKLIRGWGGEVIPDKNLSRTEVKGKRVEALLLEDGTRLTARAFVFLQPPAVPPFHFYFTLREEWIPAPMKENLIMTWGEAPPADLLNLMALRLGLAEEEIFGGGTRGLAVTVFFRPNLDITSDRIEAVRKRILDRLQWLIPFSKSQMQEVASGGEESKLPATLRTLQKEWTEKAKDLSKGTGSLLQPREAKNVLLLQNDFSDTLAWGSSFLTAMEVATLVEQG
ncbi:MAG: hypothetical protein HY282_11180 [Nitrospirae bacterium]|nr:hypothetical protein [Candidatus Manganitrophaceae bacterium]